MCPRFWFIRVFVEVIHLRICDLIVAVVVVVATAVVPLPLVVVVAGVGTGCSAVESACFMGTIVARRSTTSLRH